MSERAEHTSGPWRRSGYGQIFGPNGMDVCFRSVTTMCSGSEKDIAEAEANTNLIAAAPDLLAALKALQLQALQSTVNDPANEWGQEALALTRAAIAIATGEA